MAYAAIYTGNHNVLRGVRGQRLERTVAGIDAVAEEPRSFDRLMALDRGACLLLDLDLQVHWIAVG